MGDGNGTLQLTLQREMDSQQEMGKTSVQEMEKDKCARDGKRQVCKRWTDWIGQVRPKWRRQKHAKDNNESAINK